MVPNSTNNCPDIVAIEDVNNDNRMDINQIDLVVTNSGGNTIGILLRHGSETFASQVTYPTSIYPFSIAVADVNNDNKLDIAVVNRDSNTVSMQNIFKAGTNPFLVAVANLNNDMIEDIVVGNGNRQSVGVFLYKC